MPYNENPRDVRADAKMCPKHTHTLTLTHTHQLSDLTRTLQLLGLESGGNILTEITDTDIRNGRSCKREKEKAKRVEQIVYAKQLKTATAK